MNQWDRDALNWPLEPVWHHDAESLPVIVEVGAFEGIWASRMVGRYPGRYVMFDPQQWALDRAEHNWQHARTHAGRSVTEPTTLERYPYALGDRDGTFDMGAWGTDANSFLKTPEWYERYPDEGRRAVAPGRMREAVVAFYATGLGAVDVMMMNIEGYEYHLVPYMIDTGLIARVRFVCIQFHEAHEPPDATEALIRERLHETHDVRWDHGPMLVCWQRRD